MSAITNRAGVACCGNCGHELAVVCTGGCSEPDIVFAKTARTPMRDRHYNSKRRRATDVPLGTCNYQGGCDQPVAPRAFHGRPTTKCAKHLAMVQQWELNRHAREAASL